MNIPGTLSRPHSPTLWKWGLRLVSLCVFALVWDLVALQVHSLLMPRFGETMIAIATLVGTPELWDALWVSNQAMVLGFALAVTTGIPLGFFMGRRRLAEKFFDPYLNILLVTPMSALIPIIIMATGLGLISRVLIVFSFAFVVIVVNARAGLRMVEPNLLEMARAFGASERQLWSKILLRGALPAVLTGLRLGLIRSVSGMITVELLLLALGVGRLILDFQGRFEAANLYATILVIVFEAVMLAQTFKWLERRATPWISQVVVE